MKLVNYIEIFFSILTKKGNQTHKRTDLITFAAIFLL